MSGGSLPRHEYRLHREVGLPGAVLQGLGSMVGAGVFVCVGIAAGVAGPSVVAATLIAALIATANGLSSAQLASALPVRFTGEASLEFVFRFPEKAQLLWIQLFHSEVSERGPVLVQARAPSRSS